MEAWSLPASSGRHIIVADEDRRMVDMIIQTRSTPEADAKLPADVPILREPFTTENLRGTVAAMLDGEGQQAPTIIG
jgi:hypothetical protein